MKGTITRCLAEFVETRYGKEEWNEILSHSKIPTEEQLKLTMTTGDVDDAAAVEVFMSAAAVLELEPQALFDLFGEHWSCVYAPRVYPAFFRHYKSARELILGIDDVHVQMTASMANSRPPRFDFEWKTDDVLLVTYKSPRNLVGVYTGLARGVGKYYGEPLRVTQLNDHEVEIAFAASAG